MSKGDCILGLSGVMRINNFFKFFNNEKWQKLIR